MLKLLPIALAALLALPAIAPAGDFDLRSLFQREQVRLSSIPRERLREMVAKPAAHQDDFRYSREWLSRQPEPTGDAQWRCLAEALYFEARGETIKGQFAVAEVIMNRVASSRFPDTPCGVIRQGTGRKYQCQFTYTCDGHAEVIAEPRAFKMVGKIARATLDGRSGSLTDGATHYHTTAVSPRWSNVYTRTARIGVHLFYRHLYRAAKSG